MKRIAFLVSALGGFLTEAHDYNLMGIEALPDNVICSYEKNVLLHDLFQKSVTSTKDNPELTHLLITYPIILKFMPFECIKVTNSLKGTELLGFYTATLDIFITPPSGAQIIEFALEFFLTFAELNLIPIIDEQVEITLRSNRPDPIKILPNSFMKTFQGLVSMNTPKGTQVVPAEIPTIIEFYKLLLHLNKGSFRNLLGYTYEHQTLLKDLEVYAKECQEDPLSCSPMPLQFLYKRFGVVKISENSFFSTFNSKLDSNAVLSKLKKSLSSLRTSPFLEAGKMESDSLESHPLTSLIGDYIKNSGSLMKNIMEMKEECELSIVAASGKTFNSLEDHFNTEESVIRIMEATKNNNSSSDESFPFFPIFPPDVDKSVFATTSRKSCDSNNTVEEKESDNSHLLNNQAAEKLSDYKEEDNNDILAEIVNTSESESISEEVIAEETLVGYIYDQLVEMNAAGQAITITVEQLLEFILTKYVDDTEQKANTEPDYNEILFEANIKNDLEITPNTYDLAHPKIRKLVGTNISEMKNLKKLSPYYVAVLFMLLQTHAYEVSYNRENAYKDNLLDFIQEEDDSQTFFHMLPHQVIMLIHLLDSKEKSDGEVEYAPRELSIILHQLLTQSYRRSQITKDSSEPIVARSSGRQDSSIFSDYIKSHHLATPREVQLPLGGDPNISIYRSLYHRHVLYTHLLGLRLSQSSLKTYKQHIFTYVQNYHEANTDFNLLKNNFTTYLQTVTYKMPCIEKPFINNDFDLPEVSENSFKEAFNFFALEHKNVRRSMLFNDNTEIKAELITDEYVQQMVIRLHKIFFELLPDLMKDCIFDMEKSFDIHTNDSPLLILSQPINTTRCHTIIDNLKIELKIFAAAHELFNEKISEEFSLKKINHHQLALEKSLILQQIRSKELLSKLSDEAQVDYQMAAILSNHWTMDIVREAKVQNAQAPTVHQRLISINQVKNIERGQAENSKANVNSLYKHLMGTHSSQVQNNMNMGSYEGILLNGGKKEKGIISFSQHPLFLEATEFVNVAMNLFALEYKFSIMKKAESVFSFFNKMALELKTIYNLAAYHYNSTLVIYHAISSVTEGMES